MRWLGNLLAGLIVIGFALVLSLPLVFFRGCEALLNKAGR